MKFNALLLIEAILIIAISVFWCEFGYYYFIFYFNCSSWPGIESSFGPSDNNLIKLMVISDTHIMGPVKSFKLDKLRREWQMKQAFSISNKIFRPDAIIFLGDLFDEASFSSDKAFHAACKDFESIFEFDHEQQEFIVIPGNHDVGFHDRMKSIPYLLHRFSRTFLSTESIELSHTAKTQHLNLILSNSMSFYNDSCLYCSQSRGELRQLEEYLEHLRAQNPDGYVQPILFGHIPLHRDNDLNCSYPKNTRTKVARGNIEGEDVLHKSASKALLTRLKPRLIVSGHTHMLCHTNHLVESDDDQLNSYYEITAPSYNHKYAELKPGFLLITANLTDVFTKHCNLIEEWVVASVYIIALLTISLRILFTYRNRTEEEAMLNPSTVGGDDEQ